jgi:two-component system sensor histidine kinase KdpD
MNTNGEQEHLLVCISSSPSCAATIREAAGLYARLGGRFTALFIETPNYALMKDADRNRLAQNLHLAEKAGARVDTRYGDDTALRIAEYVRTGKVTRVVIGAGAQPRFRSLRGRSLTERLVSQLPDTSIYVIPCRQDNVRYANFEGRERGTAAAVFRDTVRTALVLLAATLLGFFFIRIGIKESNVITLYFLAVLIISVVTSRKVYGLLASVLCVVLFNFLFVKPVFSMHAYDAGYFVTFGVMLISSFITSSLASRLKDYAEQMSRRAYRTRILLDTNQMLLSANTAPEILSVAGRQVSKLLGRATLIYPVEDGKLGSRTVFCPEEKMTEPSKEDAAAVAWVLQNRKRAGAGTSQYPQAQYQYLAIRSPASMYAIVGIRAQDGLIRSFEYSICLSILGECALASENERNLREKEQADMSARNEQLRANLLRTVSHDLRTPLTSISGNASNLLLGGDSFDDATKRQIYEDIRSDSMWLIATVENLLSVTRLENGDMHIKRNIELMDEIIEEGLRHLDPRKDEHRIKVVSGDEPLLVSVDAHLMVQVIINLVNNAIKYTQAGSVITISSSKHGSAAVVSVADNGPGVPEEEKKHIFEMFYSGSSSVADRGRSLGLGLALCRSIVEAHGGSISVCDAAGGGADFVFALPVVEIDTAEETQDSEKDGNK